MEMLAYHRDRELMQISKMLNRWILGCIEKEMKAPDQKTRQYYWKKEKALRAMKRQWLRETIEKTGVAEDEIEEISDDESKRIPRLESQEELGESEVEEIE